VASIRRTRVVRSGIEEDQSYGATLKKKFGPDTSPPASPVADTRSQTENDHEGRNCNDGLNISEYALDGFQSNTGILKPARRLNRTNAQIGTRLPTFPKE